MKTTVICVKTTVLNLNDFFYLLYLTVNEIKITRLVYFVLKTIFNLKPISDLYLYIYSGAAVTIADVTCTVTTDTATQLICTTGAHSTGSIEADVIVDVSGERANRVSVDSLCKNTHI